MNERRSMAEMSESAKDARLREACAALEATLGSGDRAVLLVVDASGQVHLGADMACLDVVPVLRRAAQALEERG